MFKGTSALLMGALTLGVCGCQALQDIAALQKALGQKYPGSNIHVQVVNGATCNVTFVNSTVAGQSSEEQQAFAREVAECVRDEYPGYGSLEQVNVLFTSLSQWGPVSVKNTAAVHRFPRKELE